MARAPRAARAACALALLGALAACGAWSASAAQPARRALHAAGEGGGARGLRGEFASAAERDEALVKARPAPRAPPQQPRVRAVVRGRAMQHPVHAARLRARGRSAGARRRYAPVARGGCLLSSASLGAAPAPRASRAARSADA
jgi:hypothetical protein